MNLTTKRFFFLSILALSLSLSCQEIEKEEVAAQPNFLWLSVEDLSPRLGCYGDQIARTPTLDELAAEGVRYENAFTTAGVCAPSRSAIITGMFQNSIGTQSRRPTIEPLPPASQSRYRHPARGAVREHHYPASRRLR